MRTLLLFMHRRYITDQPLMSYCSLQKHVFVPVCGLPGSMAIFKIASTHTQTDQQRRVSPAPRPLIREQCVDNYWAGSEVSTVYWLSWQQWRGPFIGGLTVLESLKGWWELQSMLGATLLDTYCLKVSLNCLQRLKLSCGCFGYSHVVGATSSSVCIRDTTQTIWINKLSMKPCPGSTLWFTDRWALFRAISCSALFLLSSV